MKFLRLAFAVAVVSSLTGATSSVDSSPFYAGLDTPESFNKQAELHLAKARQALDRLLAVKGRRTAENTLRPYDDITLEIEAVSGPGSVIVNMHPDDRMRQAADAEMTRAQAIKTERSTNRAVYDALAAIDASREDAETKFYLSRELRTFRLSGVDKDEATRARLAQLRGDVETAAREFLRNINNSQRTITVASAADLDGLPPDLIALRRKPFAPPTSDSRHGFLIVPNLLRGLVPSGLDQIWVAERVAGHDRVRVDAKSVRQLADGVARCDLVSEGGPGRGRS